jgi:hypothetical protein
MYVADFYNNRVVELSAESSTQTELSFTGVVGRVHDELLRCDRGPGWARYQR